MIRHILIAISIFCSASAMANPVRVSGTATEDVARLIFEFERRPIWDYRRRGGGYSLSFSNVTPLSFDFSQVFLAMDRSRLADIRAVGNNSVEIDLACDCVLQLSETGNDAIAVDIRKLDPRRPTAQTVAPLLATTEQSEPALETPVLTGRSITRMGPGSLDPLTSTVVFLPQLPTSLPAPNATSSLTTDRSLAVELVGRGLSRAASQGLVTAGDNIPKTERTPPEMSAVDVLAGRANLTVTTGFDRETRPDARDVPPSVDGAICLSERSVDVLNWGDARDPKMLGTLRNASISEDGSVNESGAKALARYYIHLGFGVEARATAQFLESGPDRQIIIALAEIMDDGRSDAEVFQGQVACDGSVALWAALSGPLAQTQMPNNTNAILTTFSALPPHLRSHLGPTLSERLHDAGLHKDARTALNAVTRGGTRTDESDLATARLELDGTHADGAREKLSDLSNGTDITAAGALLELLKDAEARDMAPNPAWVDDAPTLVGALEGTEIASELNLAGLRGLIALGRFDAFRETIVEDSPGVTPETRLDLAVRALDAATNSGSDAELLTTEIGLAKLVPAARLDATTRVQLAARLRGLGLANRALRYVIRAPESESELTVAISAYVAAGQFAEALEVTRASPLDASDRLFAEVLIASGKKKEAFDQFVSVGDTESAVEVALRLGEWNWIALNTDDEIATASRELISPVVDPEPDAEAPNGDLIAALRARRAQVRSLLQATELRSPAFTN